MTASGLPSYDLTGKRLWVAGHAGMVGSAIVRRLAPENCEIVTVGRDRVDLKRQQETEEWMAEVRPNAVFLAAATVGGIVANDARPADFIYDNLAIAANVIHAASTTGVEKLLFLGSSCIYPRLAEQPMNEDALLTGPLEPTNQWYAIAKIAGIKLCKAFRRQYGCNFISIMPANLYGVGDNFDLISSHVVPALIRKCHEAKCQDSQSVEIWGTGRPRREFLYVDDLADAALHLMKVYSGEPHINVGTGTDVTISELAETVARVVGYDGSFAYDYSKPDGAPRKLLDISRIRSLGWSPETSLEDGLRKTYGWFCANYRSTEEAGENFSHSINQ